MSKKIFKKKKITGVALVLILLTYVCASSSVYAKTLRDIPDGQKTIAEPDEEELIAAGYSGANTCGRIFNSANCSPISAKSDSGTGISCFTISGC